MAFTVGNRFISNGMTIFTLYDLFFCFFDKQDNSDLVLCSLHGLSISMFINPHLDARNFHQLHQCYHTLTPIFVDHITHKPLNSCLGLWRKRGRVTVVGEVMSNLSILSPLNTLWHSLRHVLRHPLNHRMRHPLRQSLLRRSWLHALVHHGSM